MVYSALSGIGAIGERCKTKLPLLQAACIKINYRLAGFLNEQEVRHEQELVCMRAIGTEMEGLRVHWEDRRNFWKKAS